MVSKEEIIKTLQDLKKISPNRKFAQSVDFILNLKELDLKKPEEQLDVWVPLSHDRGKKVRIGALVGPEMKENAKAACDTVITHDEFRQYEGKKKDIRKLARTHDLFIAQANIMPDVAKFFGRVLGPRGKMPNPKGGCVVPPNANLKVVTDRLKKTLHVVAKTQMSAKCSIGKQDMPEDQLAENILTVYNAAIHGLPQEHNNIKSLLLKYSMGPVLRIGATAEEVKRAAEHAAPKEKEAPKSAAEAPAGEAKAEKPKKASKPKAAKAKEGES